jgi:hypothetical protein
MISAQRFPLYSQHQFQVPKDVINPIIEVE